MKEYKYKVNGVEYTVNINSIQDGKAHVVVNGTPYDVEIEGQAPAAQPAAPAPAAPQPAAAAPAPKAEEKPAAQPAPAPAPAGGSPVKAPLPGIINDIKVKVGDQVKAGQTVVILEAMKMENEITAETAGTVTSIAVNKGDNVMEGAVLVTIG
ncbi:MAG: biotin/lipoyl-binding protein [Prevotellaceae bacterium]|jgi:biotin carboxyl carrier protein|nr:biotin/lipoyl-binding protein [Prevotellaceae bacterium]MDY3856072.1 biotin/lipoyl-containing protein [Bacteroidaceae bacterium]